MDYCRVVQKVLQHSQYLPQLSTNNTFQRLVKYYSSKMEDSRSLPTSTKDALDIFLCIRWARDIIEPNGHHFSALIHTGINVTWQHNKKKKSKRRKLLRPSMKEISELTAELAEYRKEDALDLLRGIHTSLDIYTTQNSETQNFNKKLFLKILWGYSASFSLQPQSCAAGISLEISRSNPVLKHIPTAGCTGRHPDRGWISPEKDTFLK